MPRRLSGYDHWCRMVSANVYEIGWYWDRASGAKSKYFRLTDKKGADRFCKKWGVAIDA